MFKISVYSLLLAWLPSLLQAQHRKYVFNRISTKDGLASNHVYSILQDQKGFMWLGTANGLQRYDGRKAVMFRPPVGDKSYLPAAPIKQVAVDINHHFWVRTEQEVGIFDPVNFKYKKAIIEPGGAVAPRAEYFLWLDSKGNIFLIITQLGVLAYDWKTNTFKKDNSRIQTPKGWSVRKILEDPHSGNYWMATDSGLAQYNIRSKSLSYFGHNTEGLPILDNPLFRDPVTVMFIDKKDRFWLTTWSPTQDEKFYCFNLDSNKLSNDTAGLKTNTGVYKEMHGFMQESNGRLWTYGTKYLEAYDTLTKRFQYIRQDYIDDYDIRFDIIYCMYEDREQNCWIGTDEGVFVINSARQLFHSIVMDGPTNGSSRLTLQPNAFLQTRENKLLVASWGLGTLSCDSNFLPIQNAVLKGMPAGERDYFLQWSLHEEKRSGRIWIGCQGGRIIIYDPLTNKSIFYKVPLAEDRTIRQITEDKAGNILLATQYGHIIRWNPSAGYGAGFLQGFKLLQNVNTIIYKMICDKSGSIWLCTHMKGVFTLNAESGKVIAHYDKNGGPGKSLYADIAGDIVQYDDSLFFVSSGALSLINQKTGNIQLITTDNGLPSMSVTSIEKDKENNLWLGLSDGICRYNYKRQIFTLFNQKDGIVYGNFRHNASTRLHNGQLIFGNSHNFVYFQPELAYSSAPPLDVTITDFKLFNNYLAPDSIMKLDKVVLNYTQNSITIEFAALSFLQRDKIVYYYQLDGFDKEWIRPDKGLFASYTALPPGNYTFRVMCENADGVESKNITSLKIYIRPPFWLTWWFLMLIVIAIAALIYFIHRLRVDQLLGMERVRTRIARDLHDDMGSTLSTINILSEMAKMKVDKDSEKTSEYLTKISDNSSRMMEAMDDIVWSINPMNDNMQRIAARMREFATGVLEARNIDFTFRVDEEVQNLKLDMEARRDFFLLFKEAVNNLAKYSQCQHATIDISIIKERLIMKIMDDGVGFDVQQADSGNGLYNMRKRAQSLNGSLAIESSPGKGTKVLLDVPLT
ncbi:two-component regulator propeller domain-containing protein [Paraflavitalea sp. CAU 1676]|uniref:sensor histidine kinase n=1 Tax=Paraflavitalea sp. CAU 1676 TaxID=3032598 RepID=UPI0023DAC927|nr:two-component regulator propeller domain-containing protein [Paraflavitalea sp. CAU 1676]MDF2191037.1 two-component regulator propeller domain-containing protein [Paraflavitalea sp. CAU 1676]